MRAMAALGALSFGSSCSYVGGDGQPSGATLDLDELNVTYVIPTDAGLPTDTDGCVICPGA